MWLDSKSSGEEAELNAKSGTIKISSIEGNTQALDGGSMFGNAPRAVWQRWCPPDELGRIKLSCRAMLVETEKHKILCETGIGAFFEPKLAERYGVIEGHHVLVESLAAKNLKPEDIDFVILSHLHFDHAGGLLSEFKEGEQPKLIFSNARFVVGQTAWERSKDPHPRDRASFIPNLAEMLEASGRLLIVGESKPEITELGDTFQFRYSDGHTPGQMHTVVCGASRQVVFCGDLIPGAAWVHLPITMGYDRFAELVIDEKKKLYDDLAGGENLFFFTHDAELAAGCVKQLEAKRKYVVVEEFPSLVDFVI